MSGSLEILDHAGGLMVLLGLSAFFSGAETALFSLRPTDIRRMRSGTPGERAAVRLLKEPQHLLATLLVGNLVVNVLLASIIASLFHRLLGEHGVAVAVVLSTFLLLIFGEVTPKTIAVRHAAIYARTVAVPLWLCSLVVTPARAVLGAVTTVILRMLGLRDARGWGTLTREDLLAALKTGHPEQTAHAGGNEAPRIEWDVAERILEFQTIEARDVMTPRPDIRAVRDDMTLEQAFLHACRERLDDVPICHEDLDDIWGVLKVARAAAWKGRAQFKRKLAAFRRSHDWSNGSGTAPTPIAPVAVVPETVGLDLVLKTLQERGAELAVVVDEFGGTSGTLSLDDILAELIGRLPGHAPGAGRARFRRVGDAILADGRASLRMLNRELPEPIPDDLADSVGGYVTALIGRLPRRGDTVDDDHYHFTVERMAGRRVGLVRIETLKKRESAGNGIGNEEADSRREAEEST